MVIVNLRSVDILPTLVKNATIWQDPRRVVMLDVRRKLANILPVRIGSKKDRDLRQPTVDPPIAAARDKRDTTIGEITRFNVVKIAICQLL